MRIRVESTATELHAAITEAWERARQEATCPECDGTGVSESGICWDCQASDYLEDEK
jgi:DnaJ-class molecular chaperone